jgi:hypothetical protein
MRDEVRIASVEFRPHARRAADCCFIRVSCLLSVLDGRWVVEFCSTFVIRNPERKRGKDFSGFHKFTKFQSG